MQSVFFTPVTLKQAQGHQTWHELVDSMQVYDHATFERPPLKGVRKKKSNMKVFLQLGNVSIISLEYTRRSKIAWYTKCYDCVLMGD